MRDEMDARIWVEHGADFSASLDRFFKDVAVALRRLHEIQFSAPWRRDHSQRRPGQA
jgi:uncharacterized membrane protein YhaH (DUF805 family)